MVIRNDLTLYDRHADDWWNVDAPAFRSLHAVNDFRVALLDEWIGSELQGQSLLDLGCGGGLLSEAMARRGAEVIGVDLSRPSLRVAKTHAAKEKLRPRPRYLAADIHTLPFADGAFDGVLFADVIEHVDDPTRAVAEAARVLRPDGWLYVSTINRTLRSRWLVAELAEWVGLIPRGTHDARMFITPEELDSMAECVGAKRVERQGEAVRLWATIRKRRVALRKGASLAGAYSALYRS